MQRKAAGKAGHRLEAVAVEYGHVMVAAFDHDEEIQRVGLVLRGGGQAF
jgi:hypothetical protein